MKDALLTKRMSELSVNLCFVRSLCCLEYCEEVLSIDLDFSVVMCFPAISLFV